MADRQGSPSARLHGRVVLVTGAARGIGAATARRLAADGARLVLADLDGPGVEKVAAELGQVAVQADVTRRDDVDRMIDEAYRRWDRLDVLFNNAGVIRVQPFLEVTEEEWDRVLDVNLKGSFLVAKHVLPTMLAQRSGSIVHVASVEGLEGMSRSVAYNASKGGVVLMTRNMALDYAKDGIRVNCLCPGAIDTPLTAVLALPETRAIREQMVAWHAMGRFGTPEEVAAAALFLASDDASFVTGHALAVDGGWTAGRQIHYG